MILLSSFDNNSYVINFILFSNRHLKKGISDWESSEQSKWVLDHPGQVVLTVV